MAKEIDEIKKAAGDYQKWALAARKQYINLRLRQDKEIANLYIRSADRIAKELQQIGTTTISGQIQKKHLKELEKSLRAEAELIQKGLTEAFVDYIDTAAKAGIGYTQGVVLNLFDQAGLKTSGIRKLYSRVNKQAVEAIWARTRNGLYLSDRIWEQGEKYRNTMRDIIQESVAIGQDAVKTARMLQQYVRQGAMTLARDYPEMMKRMKGRIPGNISYEALRLARTEMTAAFGEGTIAASRVAPSYIGMKWALSGSHPMPDICDTLSTYDSGLGPGVYPPGDEPPYPAHPNCLCALVPIHEEPEKFVERLKKWRDDPSSDQELEKWYNDIYQEKAAEKQNRLTQSIKELEIGLEAAETTETELYNDSLLKESKDSVFEKMLKEYSAEYKEKLTDEEVEAIIKYQSTWYIDINGFLRGRLDSVSRKTKTYIENLQKAIEKVTIKENLLVARGTTLSAIGGDWNAARINDIITDEGFTSTSLTEKTAIDFVNRKGERGILMYVKIPKGTNGVIADVAVNDNWENELLLAPGTKIRITGKRIENGMKIVEGVVVNE